METATEAPPAGARGHMRGLSGCTRARAAKTLNPDSHRDIEAPLTTIRTFADFQAAFKVKAFAKDLDGAIAEITKNKGLGKHLRLDFLRHTIGDYLLLSLEKYSTPDRSIKAALSELLKEIERRENIALVKTLENLETKATRAAVVIFLQRILQRLPDAPESSSDQAPKPEIEK